MNGCSFVCVCAFGRYMRVCTCVQKLLKGDTFVCAGKKRERSTTAQRSNDWGLLCECVPVPGTV